MNQSSLSTGALPPCEDNMFASCLENYVKDPHCSKLDYAYSVQSQTDESQTRSCFRRNPLKILARCVAGLVSDWISIRVSSLSTYRFLSFGRMLKSTAFCRLHTIRLFDITTRISKQFNVVVAVCFGGSLLLWLFFRGCLYFGVYGLWRTTIRHDVSWVGSVI